MTDRLQSEIEFANQLYQQCDGKSWDSYSGYRWHEKMKAIWPLLLAELETSAKDHRAMAILRADDGYNGCLDQVEDNDGTCLWQAEVGAWGIATCTDPAEAIIKANTINAEHKMLNPIKMEEK